MNKPLRANEVGRERRSQRIASPCHTWNSCSAFSDDRIIHSDNERFTVGQGVFHAALDRRENLRGIDSILRIKSVVGGPVVE